MRESSCWSLWSPRSIIVARPDCCSRCHWHLGPVLILYVVYLKIIISRVSKTKRKKKKTYPSGAGRWRLPVLFGPLFPSLWRRLTAALVAISRVVAVIPFLLHFASPVLRTCSLLFVNLNNRLKEKKKKITYIGLEMRLRLEPLLLFLSLALLLALLSFRARSLFAHNH